MSKLPSTIYKSLVRAVSDLVDEVEATTGVDVQYHSWEERGEENTLPAVTLIGLDGWNFDENTGLWVIRCGVTVSTFNDLNLINESEILDVVHERFGFHKTVLLRDTETGDPFSEMVVTSFHIMPMGQSELRNYRMVGLELLRTDSSEAG